MRRRVAIAAALGAVVGIVATAWWQKAPADDEASGGPFDAAILAAAGDYEEWETADGRAHWAPWLCRAPTADDIRPVRKARISESDDGETHGRKIYYLYTKDRPAYLAHDDRDQPVGQALVKQSWAPRELTEEEARAAHAPTASRVDRPAERDGKLFGRGRQAELFVMLKVDPKTPGTDAGWVYATVSPDGRKVTSAGRIESCMECHGAASRDRMLGVD